VVNIACLLLRLLLMLLLLLLLQVGVCGVMVGAIPASCTSTW
jgi:hypothetical protein